MRSHAVTWSTVDAAIGHHAGLLDDVDQLVGEHVSTGLVAGSCPEQDVRPEGQTEGVSLREVLLRCGADVKPNRPKLGGKHVLRLAA